MGGPERSPTKTGRRRGGMARRGGAPDGSLDIPQSLEQEVLIQMASIHQRHREVLQKYQEQEDQNQLAKMKAFVATIEQSVPEEGEKGSKVLARMKAVLWRLEHSSSLRPAFTRWLHLQEERWQEDFGAKMRDRLKRRGRWQHRIKLLNQQREAEAQQLEGNEQSRLWQQICRKQIPKVARIMAQTIAARAYNARRIAAICAKEQIKAQTKLQKTEAREIGYRSRRSMKEMLTFWKRNEREERELRKRAEKEAAERRRQEEEEREARRQAKKLQFLITQTELYSHFIARKSAVPTSGSGANATITTTTIIPSEKTLKAGIDFADLDDSALAAQAELSAKSAFLSERQKRKQFDADSDRHRKEAGGDTSLLGQELDNLDFKAPSTMNTERAEVLQPRMLQCQLKGYQLKGLTWLVNLYEQGINGILADEMGLGKTVQAISLMAYLAEAYNIWGPFLVIAPASTLHNWQQEIARFVPGLRALPYWGSANDRKTLRRFWNPKRLYTKESNFHILITSYQLIVADEKYFQRIKWQYMILDEAQAIKSSSSVRWKTLLSFQCRNRLLLTGTPIQNSMQELWALLHFIMPGLFDSHDEFSDWFSRDIENHAAISEAKSGASTLNEHQLQRLHMILKPFMLRRVKKDVENELGEKIELEVDCQLTPRQRHMYRAIRDKLPLAELLEMSSSSAASDSLMNIVMQFRKVCNHPEIFERTEIRSPLFLHELDMIRPTGKDGSVLFWDGPLANPISFRLPKLLSPSQNTARSKFLEFDASIFHPQYIHSCMDLADDPFAATQFSSLLQRADLPLLLRQGFVGLGWRAEESFQELDGRWTAYIERPERFRFPWQRGIELLFKGAHLKQEIVSSQSLEIDLQHNPLYREHSMDFEQEMRLLLHNITTASSPRVVCTPPELVVEDVNYALLDECIMPPLGKASSAPHLWDFCETDALSGRYIAMPSQAKLISDSGKLVMLDHLLAELKAGGHRVLIYNQMTRMIDLMEEYLHYRGHSYIRLDGSSKISDRRDLVSDWQTRPDIFIFLLSTRAGGLGINLTAADTVIFYDSDWNPTVDQQAMDRAHRLGQTKQVTVYRLITRGTIEERMRQRAKQKDEIHRVVIAGGEFKQMDSGRPMQKDIVSLLLEEGDKDTGMTPLKRRPVPALENGNDLSKKIRTE